LAPPNGRAWPETAKPFFFLAPRQKVTLTVDRAKAPTTYTDRLADETERLATIGARYLTIRSGRILDSRL
jgi:hypothetical protein